MFECASLFLLVDDQLVDCDQTFSVISIYPFFPSHHLPLNQVASAEESDRLSLRSGSGRAEDAPASGPKIWFPRPALERGGLLDNNGMIGLNTRGGDDTEFGRVNIGR